MLIDIGQEILQLTQDRKFVNNFGFVVMLTLSLFFRIVTVGANEERVVKQGKVERISELMSVGLCIRTQIVIKQ